MRAPADSGAQGVRRVVLPRWLAAGVLGAAVPGISFMVYGIWLVFPPRQATDYPFLVDVRFVDRAQLWVDQGPGSGLAVASLLALAGYSVIELSPTIEVEPSLPRRTRLGGLFLASLLGLLEVSGIVALTGGYVQFVADPTAIGSLSLVILFHSPTVVLCLVVAILAAADVWALRRELSAGPTADLSRAEEPDLSDPDPGPPTPDAYADVGVASRPGRAPDPVLADFGRDQKDVDANMEDPFRRPAPARQGGPRVGHDGR